MTDADVHGSEYFHGRRCRVDFFIERYFAKGGEVMADSEADRDRGTPEQIRAILKGLLTIIQEHRNEINDIAKQHIQDFHFLNDRIVECSYGFFWNCDNSPIGICVFGVLKNGQTGSCRYCGGPKERK